MAADGIPFCEDFDKWRDRVRQTHSSNLDFAEDASLLMGQTLQYIERTVDFDSILHAARKSLRAHFIMPDASSELAAIEAINALDDVLDYISPSAVALATLVDWQPKQRE